MIVLVVSVSFVYSSVWLFLLFIVDLFCFFRLKRLSTACRQNRSLALANLFIVCFSSSCCCLFIVSFWCSSAAAFCLDPFHWSLLNGFNSAFSWLFIGIYQNMVCFSRVTVSLPFSFHLFLFISFDWERSCWPIITPLHHKSMFTSYFGLIQRFKQNFISLFSERISVGSLPNSGPMVKAYSVSPCVASALLRRTIISLSCRGCMP